MWAPHRAHQSRRRARNHRQAAGQVAWSFPQSSTRDRSQNENRSRASARARRRVVSANEKKEKRKKRNNSGRSEKLGKTAAWSKMILIIKFSPITKLFRLRFPFLLFSSSSQRRTKPSSFIFHADHTRFWTREKKAIDVQQNMPCHTTTPRSCPRVLVSCRLSFPSLQRQSLFLIDVCTSRRGADACCDVRHTVMWRSLRCTLSAKYKFKF